jgi:chromosome segregation ATPase
MRSFSIDRARFDAMERRKKQSSAGYGRIMDEIANVENSLAWLERAIAQADSRDRDQSRELHQPAISRHQRELERLERQKEAISRENQIFLRTFERCQKLVARAEAEQRAAEREAVTSKGEQPHQRGRLKPQREPVLTKSIFADADEVGLQVSEAQAFAGTFRAGRES